MCPGIMKLMNVLPIDFHSDFDGHVPFKVSLFSRIHEMEGITEQLMLISAQPVAEKKKWFKDNEAYLRQLLEKFADHLPVELDDDKMDTQTMGLLFEYTSHLQQMVAIVQNMLKNYSKLRT
jgi:hypothetical protein